MINKIISEVLKNNGVMVAVAITTVETTSYFDAIPVLNATDKCINFFVEGTIIESVSADNILDIQLTAKQSLKNGRYDVSNVLEITEKEG